MSSRYFNHYLIVSITGLVVFLSVVLLFNYFVNPYNVFNSPIIKSGNGTGENRVEKVPA